MSEQKGNTLTEVLATIDPNEIVHIGAKNGTGFFYIGHPQDFDEGLHTMKSLESLRAAEAFFKDKLDNMDTFVVPRMALPVYSSDGETVESYVNASARLYERLHRIADDVIKRANEIKTAEKRLIHTREVLATFIPLGMRKVLEQYPRIQEDGIILLIEGEEPGLYWSIKEVEREKGKRH